MKSKQRSSNGLRWSLRAVLPLLVAMPAIAADADLPALVGVWGSERVFGPAVHGVLTIDGRQPEWRASIGGFDIVVHREGSQLSFDLGLSAGMFRGEMIEGAVHGH